MATIAVGTCASDIGTPPCSLCCRHVVGGQSCSRNEVTLLAKRARSAMARVNSPTPSAWFWTGRKRLCHRALDDPHRHLAHLSCAAFVHSPSAGVCGGMGKLATREAEHIGIAFDPPLGLA